MNIELEIVVCPDCFGDGIETCHNPEHGFLSAIGGIVGANESACPCCGHNQDHKIMKYTCDTCKGSGEVTKDAYDVYLDEFVPEDDIDLVNEHCLKSINP